MKPKYLESFRNFVGDHRIPRDLSTYKSKLWGWRVMTNDPSYMFMLFSDLVQG